MRRKSLPSWERGLKLLQNCKPQYREESLPSWERGLKSDSKMPLGHLKSVAPLVGARIEIDPFRSRCGPVNVAPLVGARIEMSYAACGSSTLPVAPLVGARIEIIRNGGLGLPGSRRSPRGSAD